MKTGKWQKKWAAIFLALVLMINMLFNHSSFLTVFAEDAPEATTEKVEKKEEKTEKKEEKTEKKEEKTEEKKEEKKELDKDKKKDDNTTVDKSSDSKKEDGSTADKTDDSKKEDETTADKTDDSKKEDGSTADKSDDSKKEDGSTADKSDSSKGDGDTSEKKEETSEEKKEDVKAKKGLLKAPSPSEDTVDITINVSGNGSVKVETKVVDDEGNPQEKNHNGNGTINNVKKGESLKLTAEPKGNYGYVSSVVGAITAGVQGLGETYTQTIVVPAENTEISVTFDQKDIGISNRISVNGKVVTISSATGNQLAFTHYIINGVTADWTKIPESGNITIETDGNYKIKLGYKVNDNSKKVESAESDFTIDTTKPVVGPITAPTGWVADPADGKYSLEIPVTDATSGVKKVSYKKKNSEDSSEISDSDGKYIFTGADEGEHTYVFTAEDNKGNISDPVEATIKKDNISPVVEAVKADNAELDNSKWYNAGNTFEIIIGEETKPISGIAEIKVTQLDDNEKNIAVSPSEGRYAFVPEEGKSNYRITATSGAGLSGSKDVHIQYDKTAPDSGAQIQYWDAEKNITNLYEAGQLNGSKKIKKIKILASDNLSGIKNIVAKYNGNNSLSFVTPQPAEDQNGKKYYEMEADVDIKAMELKTVEAESLTDNAGNTATDITLTPSETMVQYVDDTPPELTSITLPSFDSKFKCFFTNEDFTPVFKVKELTSFADAESGEVSCTYKVGSVEQNMSINSDGEDHLFTAGSPLSAENEKEEKYALSFTYADASAKKLVCTANLADYEETVKFSEDTGTLTTNENIVIDKKAPDIKNFAVDNNNIVTKDSNNKKWYAGSDNGEKSEITLSFEVDETYLDESSLKIIANDGSTDQDVTDGLFSDGKYQVVFSQPGTWKFSAYAKDKAGNDTTLPLKDGENEISIVISNSRPTITVTYMGAPYTADGEDGSNIYYNSQKTKFEVALVDELGINSTGLVTWDPNTATPLAPDKSSDGTEKYTLDSEGIYKPSIKYKGKNGLAPTVKVIYDGSQETISNCDNYTGKTVIVDHTPPKVTALTFNEGVNNTKTLDGNKKIYLNVSGANATMNFTLEEIYLSRSSLKVLSENIELATTPESVSAEQIYTTTFNINNWPKKDTSHEYAINFGDVRDKAGNPLVIDTEPQTTLSSTKVVIDNIAPTLKVVHKADRAGTFEDTKLYTKDYSADFIITEENYVKTDDDKGLATLKKDNVSEIKESNEFSVVFDKDELKEHHYYLTYTDPSGNTMVKAGDNGESGVVNNGGNIKGTWTKAAFTSPTILIDNTAPVLNNFVISNGDNIQKTVDGKDKIYLNNPENYQSSIKYSFKEQFTFSDSEDGTPVSTLDEKTVELKANGPVIIKLTNEDNKPPLNSYTASISKSILTKDGDYTLTLVAKDKAGNEFHIDDTTEEIKKQIDKTIFVRDTVAPVLALSYSDAISTLGNSLRPAHKDKTELFYKAQPTISLTLTEHNYISGESDVNFSLSIALTDSPDTPWGKAVDTDKLAMDGSGEIFTYDVNLVEPNSHNFFDFEYTDFSGNKMELETAEYPDENYSGEYTNNVHYTSPIITRDNTAPLIKTTFNGTPKYPNDSTSADRDKSTRYYYQNNQTMTIIVTEENFIPDEDGKIKYSVYDFDNDTKNKIDNKDISWNANYTYTADGKKQFKGTIKFDEEWNYKIKTDVTDRCNQTAATSDNITIDGTKPYISIQDIENTSKSDVTYHNNTLTGPLSDFLDYKLFGYFHKNLMKVKITAHDKISGVYRIKYVITHEDGTITSGEWKFDSPAESQTEYITIPVNAKDRIEITPIDFSRVTGNKVNPRGGISETQAYHDANSTMSIKINTSPSNTVGKMKYFRTAVNATITMKDGHAGIRSYEYTAGTAVSGSHNYGNDAGDKDKKGDPGTSIKYEETFNPTMAAGDTNYTNRANPTVIKASFIDNVGHSSKAEEKIVIDNKAPVIKVAWNSSVQPMNKKYYRATRTATITVNERNFNDKGVKWKINNMKGVNISGWSHNGDTNTCTVAFTQDGDDFLLDFDITDYAMNKASCPKQETFTIDKTAPVISITYDNNNASNGFYFNRARTATLHVQEHNFQASDVKYEMTASNDGHGIGNPGVGGWSMGGDHHTASIGYNTDGEYSLNFNYTDMAGNPANKLSTDKFVIDLTKPAVEIINVTDRHAYPGKITPGVKYSDTNLDESQLSIKMIGNKVGNTDNNKNYNRNNSRNIHNGRVIEWSDFKRKAEVDDIYTFEVVAKDKAGNTNEPAKVTFSVNRFGSNYIFGQQTEELLTKEHPYTNEEIPIEVTEINVTQLKEKAVSIQDENNNIRELAEGTDYKVTEGSDKYKWKEYSYLIDKENFVNEGQYTVTLSSVDGAENKMNNITKKKEIEFVIDKTNPTGTVSGLEEDHYQEDSHDITLRANDNYGLQGGELYVGGTKVGEYDGAMLTAAEGVTETLTSSNEPQKVQMKVFDWAGNEEIIDPLNGNGVLVNASWFIQWFNQKPLFYGSLGGAAAVVLGVVGVLTKGFGYSASMASGTGFWWLIFGKRRRDDEEE